jgi:hypothetical protein
MNGSVQLAHVSALNRVLRCGSWGTHTKPCSPFTIYLQTIASPFQFERLLHGVTPVPYVLTQVAKAAELPSGMAGSTIAAPAVSLVDVAGVVRSRVHAMLGPEVCMHDAPAALVLDFSVALPSSSSKVAKRCLLLPNRVCRYLTTSL